MKSFSEREKICELTFGNNGPFWHVYSSGKTTPILFSKTEDFVFAMNVIAQAAHQFRPSYSNDGRQTGGVAIITFEVMGNHFHFVLSGDMESIEAFLAFIKRRLSRTIDGIRDIEFGFKQIQDLNYMRTSIVYINRNGYVANPEHTPFTYPWGSGRYYFNTITFQEHYSDIYLGPKRKMFRGRAPELPEDWPLIDGYIAPPAYCLIKFGMALFRDAHHYFNAITKNVESYSEMAQEFDDGEFLTDTELFSKVQGIVRDQYRVSSIRDLPKAQKMDIARTLHYDFRSSNGQIRRVLGLTQYEVDSLFPLSSK